MDDTKECAICGEPIEDENFAELPDGRIVCNYCYENELYECDECGERFPEDDMENWGDDMRLCPDCFRKYFPDFNAAENLKETEDAYEEMKSRFVGRKLEDWEDLCIKTDMDDENFSYSLEIDVDDNNIITDISPLKIERCQWIGITRECWLPYPISIDDYEEGGLVDSLIESNVTFAEEK